MTSRIPQTVMEYGQVTVGMEWIALMASKLN